ncbi:carbon storage regulator CsrA [Peptococcaceae bacterium 1198_IL3148]
MLVLSRKKGQSINIGNNIVVVVLDAQKDQVRLGVEAPQDVDIYRTEIYKAVQTENLKALANDDFFELLHKKD